MGASFAENVCRRKPKESWIMALDSDIRRCGGKMRNSQKTIVVQFAVLAVSLFAVLIMGGCGSSDASQQEAEQQLQKEIGAFEITANQRELAKNNEAGYPVLDAGRGNPNWINTQTRSSAS